MKMYNPKTRQADLSARERLSKYRRHKRWVRAVSVLAAVMVFVTTYSMILPTLTATRTDLSTADLPKTHTLQAGDILTLSDAIYAKYVLPVDEPETDSDEDIVDVNVNDNVDVDDVNDDINASAPHVAIVVNPAADPQDDALLAAAIRDEAGAAKLVDLSMDSQEIACVDRVYVEQHVEDFPAFSAAIMETMDAVESAALLEEEQTAILRGAVEHTLGVLSGEIEEDSEAATVLDTLEEAIDEAASEETAASMEDETDVTGDAAADAAEATQEEAAAALDEDAAVSDAAEDPASEAEAVSDEAAADAAEDSAALDDAAEGEDASATTDTAAGSEQDPAGAADGRREAEALTPSEGDADKTGEATDLTDAERLQLEKDAKSAELPITLSRVVDGVTVTAQFARDVLPSGTQLQVHAVDGAAYEELVADATGKNDRAVKPLDIGFVAGGQEVEPDGDVQITFQADFLDEQANPEVIHVTDEGSAELLESTMEDGQLTLTTDSFSVYVIAYTVDFAYEGLEYSLDGGSAITLTALFEALGIDRSVEDVESVEFSDGELVWIGQADEDTTIGALKEAHELTCEYSAELTEEQIAESNAQTVKAGEWVLISLKAFDSEESLTVRMKGGETLVVKVTDAQVGNELNGKSILIKSQNPVYAMTNTPIEWGGNQKYLKAEIAVGTNNQIWIFESVNNTGKYRIKSAVDGKYIAIGRNDYGGYNAELTDINHSSQFDIDKTNGTYSISTSYNNGRRYLQYTSQYTDRFYFADNEARVSLEEKQIRDTENLGDWLLYFDDDFSEITIHKGETITLRPYNKWEWKEQNTVIQTKHWNVSGKDDTFWNQINSSTNVGDTWSSGGSNGEAGFDWTAYIKVDDQLDTRYWAVQGYATATGDYTLTNTKNNKTIVVHVVDGDSVNRPKPIEKTANIKVNLFDYDRYGLLDGSYDESKNWWNDDNIANNNNNKNDSTNAMNGGSHFYFMSSGGGNNGNQYHWNDYTKDVANTGIVNQTLTDGYPTLAGSGQKNQSLQYLFDASKKTWNGGNNNDGMIAYPDVTGMFQKDDNGYYYFNSNTNYFYYNTETGESKLYEHTYTQTSGQAKGSLMNDKPIGFFPFKDYDATSDLSVNQNHNLNHHIGLSMDIDFYIPMNRRDDKNQPIEFDFSGDDDLWVFVEWTDEITKEKKSKLLLDLGGIHQPVTGKIDFTNDNAIKNLLPGGKNYTLKVFYLERGGCDSNCSIRFNLPLAKELTVAKKLNGLTPTERQKYLRDKFVYEIGFKKDNDEYEVPNYSDNDQYWKDEDNNPNTQPEWRSHFDLYKTTKETKDDSNHTVSYRWNSTHTALEKQTGEAVIDGRIELIADESFTISQLRREDIFYLAEENELDMAQFETPHAERLFVDAQDREHEEEVYLHDDRAKNDNKADWETKPYALLDTEKLVYTNTLLEQNIDVWKEWQDNDASDRPGEVEFKLVATVDGEPYTQETGHNSINAQWTETKDKVADTKTGNVLTGKVDGSTTSESNEYPYKLNAANGWHMSFEHLPKKTESPTGEGKDIVYSIVENPVDGYTTSEGCLVDTNEVYLDLFKFWPDDNSNHAGDKKEDINVKIQTKMGDTTYYVVAEDPRMANGEYKFKDFTTDIDQATDFPLVTKDSYGTINNLQDMFDYSTRVSAPKTYTFGEGENAKTYTPEYKLTEPVDEDDSTKGTVLFTRPKQEWRILNSKDATEITVKKTDSTKSGDQRFIAGAKFSLYKTGSPDELITAPVIKNAGTSETISLDNESKFEIPVEGITISDLQDGSYKLVELEAPDGYVITNNTTTFTVSGGKVTAWNLTGTAGNTLEIPNTPGVELPSTGGPGTRLFTILGSVLLLGAVVLLLRRRRADLR